MRKMRLEPKGMANDAFRLALSRRRVRCARRLLARLGGLPRALAVDGAARFVTPSQGEPIVLWRRLPFMADAQCPHTGIEREARTLQ